MKRTGRALTLCGAVAAVTVCPRPAVATERASYVARGGASVPGQPSGARLTSFGLPVINDSGLVAFHARLSGAGDSSVDTGVWSGTTPTTLSSMLREGDAAPGMPAGTVIGDFLDQSYDLHVTNGGQYFVTAPTRAAGGTAITNALFEGHGPSDFHNVAVAGQSTPYAPAKWATFFPVRANASGLFSIRDGNNGLWSGTSADTLRRIANSGIVPGQYLVISAGEVTDSGLVLFNAIKPRDPYFDVPFSASFVASGTNVTRLMSTGDPAPGLPERYMVTTGQPRANAAGDLVIGGSAPSNLIWKKRAGASEFAPLMTHNQLVTSPGLLWSPETPSILDSGLVICAGLLMGTGTDASNNRVIVRGTSIQDFEIIARKGDPVPGSPLKRITLGAYSVNAAGQVLILSGDTILGYDPSLGLVSLVGAGDKFKVDGTTRTLVALSLSIDNYGTANTGSYNTGERRALNDLGEVAFRAKLDGGEWAALKTRIPVAGDATADGVVDATDFHILSDNFGKSYGTPDRSAGDFNLDGAVNFVDFQMLEGNFGRTPPGIPSTVTAADYAEIARFAQSVPEPRALSLFTLAASGLGRRRRRADDTRV